MKKQVNQSIRYSVLMGLLIIAGQTGCSLTSMLRPSSPTAPVVFESTPDANTLVAAIRKNTEAVQQLNSNVKVMMDGLPVSASGTLLMERPERLRLKVGVLGDTSSGIDIGTNENQFWIFNKSSFGGSRPTVYFANHHEYAASAMQRAIPIRPQWLMDAMGLVQFDPQEKIEGPTVRNGNLELFTTLTNSGGTIHRVLTIDPRTGAVLQLAVYDGQNRLLGWARSSKHRYFPEHQANLPQHIELNAVGVDGRNMKLSVQIQSHTINSLYVDPAVTWSMPTPGDVPQVDLSRVDPGVLQQSMSPPSGQTPYLSNNQTIDGRTDARASKRPFRLGRLKGFDLLSR